MTMRLFTSADYLHVHPSVRSLETANETPLFLIKSPLGEAFQLRLASGQVRKPSLGAVGTQRMNPQNGTPRHEKELP